MQSGTASSFLVSLGGRLFRWRDYTPLPGLVVFFIWARPTGLLYGLGCGFLAVGELARLWSLRHIGGVSRTRGDLPGRDLVTSGPFGLVRNPLYLGNLFIALGTGLLTGRPAFAGIAVLLFLAQYIPIVRWEESRLRERFGDAYVAYCATIPRWIPRLAAEPQDGGPTRSLVETLRTERRTLLALIGVVTLFTIRAWIAGRG